MSETKKMKRASPEERMNRTLEKLRTPGAEYHDGDYENFFEIIAASVVEKLDLSEMLQEMNESTRLAGMKKPFVVDLNSEASKAMLELMGNFKKHFYDYFFFRSVCHKIERCLIKKHKNQMAEELQLVIFHLEPVARTEPIKSVKFWVHIFRAL